MGRSRIYALGLKVRGEVSASSRFPFLPFGLDFLCCGPAFATSRMKRSKRGHALGSNSISGFLFLEELVMPQPLKQPTSLDFTQAGIESRPQLAALIVAICNKWSSIDTMLATFLSLMLRTDRAVGVAIYYSATSLHLRLELLKTVARMTMPADMISEVGALTDETRRRSAERNKIVHCTWATSIDHPDALIRVDPAGYDIAWLRDYEKRADTLRAHQRLDPQNITDGLEIYREPDFRHILEHFEAHFQRLIGAQMRWLDDRLQQADQE